MSVKLSLMCLVVMVAVLFVGVQAKEDKFKCNAEEKQEMDDIVSRIMTYGRSDRKYPVNPSEMKKYCQEQYRLVNRLDNYKVACVKGRSKQIVSVIIFSIRQLLSVYCKNPKSKKSKELMSAAVCANAATKDYLKCNDDYVDLLLAVEKEDDSKKLLGQVCCGYVDIFKCIKEQSKAHKKICTETRVEDSSAYIRGFFDNAINVLCGEYNDQSDKCDRFSLTTLKKYSKPKPVSYFSPLVHTLVKL